MTLRTLAWGGLVGLGALAVLEAACRVLEVPSYLMPAPSDVAGTAWEHRAALAGHARTTFTEAAIGLLIAFALSFAVVAPVSLVKGLRVSVTTGLVLLQSTPVIAVGPMLSAWFGPGIAAKAVLSALIACPAIAATLLSGLTSCPREELDLYESMGASRLQMFYLLRLPRALPSLFTALSLGIPLSVLGAVVGEFVGASSGLGFFIMTQSYYLRTPEMFAAVAVTAAGSVGAVLTVQALRRRLSWERYAFERDLGEEGTVG